MPLSHGLYPKIIPQTPTTDRENPLVGEQSIRIYSETTGSLAGRCNESALTDLCFMRRWH